jgi:AraC family transcriptional regulator of adaptative response/methylated-DNA-[protein]-cysteine methyltransferase
VISFEEKLKMKNQFSDTIKYNALVRKDKSFEGLFFVGVKTTGIFCRPSCTARKPKKENVIFYGNVLDAMRDGFRPCKVCRPLQALGKTPAEVTSILTQLETEPAIRIRDYDLIGKGLHPAKIRRWFKQNHGMTFQTYQRLMRINHAYTNLKNGSKVIHAAFDSGYNSLSGFNHSFRKASTMSPRQAYAKDKLVHTRIETPLGQMFAVASSIGICILEFTDRKMLETEIQQVEKFFRTKILPGTSPHFDKLQKQLNAYFNRRRKSFDVPLDVIGTKYQKMVWQVLQLIPYGRTISYKTEAKLLGSPKAYRAVANANGQNKISIVIPCHRVIGDDGSLTGYGGGLWRKEWLLKLEKAI